MNTSNLDVEWDKIYNAAWYTAQIYRENPHYLNPSFVLLDSESHGLTTPSPLSHHATLEKILHRALSSSDTTPHIEQ